MQNHHASYQLKRARERSLAYLVLFVVMLFFGLAGTIIAILFVPNPGLLFNRGEVGQQTDAVVGVSMADIDFTFPQPVVADVQRTLLGTVTRVDLKWPWPLARQELTTIRDQPSDINDWLIVTLEPRQGRTGLEERLDPIYSNFLKPGTAEENGLTRYSFTEDSAYADSDLLVSKERKVIRCDKHPSVLGPVICERLVPYSDKLMVRIRFARKRAAEWQDMETTVFTLLAQFAKPEAG